MFIDTHAHIYLSEFTETLDTMLLEAKVAGIDRIFMPNIDISSIPDVDRLAAMYPQVCIPMMGLHPCYVKEDWEEQLTIIESALRNKAYYGVGEVGLDYYWDRTCVAQQKLAFDKQIDIALELNLPVIIHSRDSLDDTIAMIAARQSSTLRGIFHCFNGTVDQAKAAIDTGFMLGLGGVVTYKNAKLDDMIAYLPESSIVLETDAPYLAPHPYRGKQNQSKYIPVIAEKVAQIRGESIAAVAKYTSENAINLFGLTNT